MKEKKSRRLGHTRTPNPLLTPSVHTVCSTGTSSALAFLHRQTQRPARHAALSTGKPFGARGSANVNAVPNDNI